MAAGRSLSYGSIPGAVSEEISGIPFYRLITDLEAHFDEKKEELVEILQTLVKMIFRPENLMVDFVGEEKAVALRCSGGGFQSSTLYGKRGKRTLHSGNLPEKRRFLNLRSGQLRMPCR